MIVSLKSDIGRKREENQDSIFYSTELGFPLFILADGMGGYNGGALASREAVERSFYFLKSFGVIDRENVGDALRKSVIKANRDLHQMAQSDYELRGMGTTLIIAALIDSVLYVEHVGDSRVYLIRNYEIHQVTEDHTYVGALVKLGEITQEEAKYHPYKNKITRAVGSEEQIQSDRYCVEIKEHDFIVICSDGLTKMVSNQAILNYFAKSDSYSEAAADLVRMANQNGGTDNISVIVVCIEEVKK